jgi:hypothetical protein
MRIDELPWKEDKRPTHGIAKLYRDNTYICVLKTRVDGAYFVWMNEDKSPREMDALELQCLLHYYFPSNPEADKSND